MASATLVSVAEYLSTSYQPDCEYIDGILRTENPDIAVSLAENSNSGQYTQTQLSEMGFECTVPAFRARATAWAISEVVALPPIS